MLPRAESLATTSFSVWEQNFQAQIGVAVRDAALGSTRSAVTFLFLTLISGINLFCRLGNPNNGSGNWTTDLVLPRAAPLTAGPVCVWGRNFQAQIGVAVKGTAFGSTMSAVQFLLPASFPEAIYFVSWGTKKRERELNRRPCVPENNREVNLRLGAEFPGADWVSG